MKDLVLKYESIRENSVSGRYVTHLQIEQFLNKNSGRWEQLICGLSEEGRNIYELTLGKGPLKILMWSQMHGNESTTTKAVLDLLNWLGTEVVEAEEILSRCSIKIIPMLNPDGAWAYTRSNTNDIDLNRDAQDLSQAESKALREVYDRFQPAYCFNLHDQRSIFSAGKSSNPATLSFLAPAADKNRSITSSREKSMKLIVAIQQGLSEYLGECIGRYDDSFNLNCVGDTFQSMGTATILFEAGHHPGDYQRETTREYIFYALLLALDYLTGNEPPEYHLDQYNAIPSNEKLFFDVIVRNAGVLSAKYADKHSVGILYKEILQSGEISFFPEVDKVGDLQDYYGHLEFDCEDQDELTELKTNSNLYSLLI